MNIKAKITISRPCCSDGRKFINIAIKDESSGIEFFDGQMSLANFAEALTGLGHVEMGEVELRLENVGKKREIKTEIIAWDYFGKISKEDALKPFEKDGWIGYDNDLGNHHNFTPKLGFRVTFHRYV